MQAVNDILVRLPATVISICHRLEAVFSYDYVLVLDKGTVAEFERPAVLAADPNSIFSSLLRATG
jgi:ABC-type multidrug transport system fused ATPase/permease subunit